MFRAIWIAALSVILCVVLYVPSVVPPERFVDTLRIEHEANLALWGHERALRLMNRLFEWQQWATPLSTVPPPTQIEGQQGVNAAMAQEVSRMHQRLFGNAYFRSVDALVALASYRLLSVLELLPPLGLFVLVLGIDGFAMRAVRRKELVAHSAERFSAAVIAAILIGSAVVVSAFLPVSFSPVVVMAALLVMLFVLSRALVNYHSVT